MPRIDYLTDKQNIYAHPSHQVQNFRPNAKTNCKPKHHANMITDVILELPIKNGKNL